MKKNQFTPKLFTLLLSLLVLSCTDNKESKVVTHQEMDDPVSEALIDWSQVAAGLQASIVDTDTRFSRSLAPDVAQQNSLVLTGWKGETLSAQILVWNKDSVDGVRCLIEDFKSEHATLSSGIVQARFVRYVMTEEPNYKCIERKEGDFQASLQPDLLDSLDRFDMPTQSVRPIWISIQIPDDATAGTYQSRLRISAKGQKDLAFDLSLNVQNKVLPPASEWGYHLDLWQHPSAIARVSGTPVWSDEHFAQMRPLMELLASAGQKVITTTLNKDPWNNQCFDAYESMIRWTKKTDGSWAYDYTVFDKWVQFMMDMGIDKMINCYSMLPWNNELVYRDETTQQDMTIVANPGTPDFDQIWAPFLKDFVKHLKEKQWLEITNIAMDERSPEMMKEAVALLNKEAPELGISLADNHKSYERYPLIKDICVKANAKVARKDIEFRRKHNLITTYYVCCSDPFPNMFTFSSPAESCYSAWYSYAAGYDGFLRWAYNSWPEAPVTDSRFRKFPAGDTFMVYPDGRSSIRFELLREGIQDVEKIKQLLNTWEQEKTPEAQAKADRLHDMTKRFDTLDPVNTTPAGMLKEAKALINELSE